MVGGEDNWMAVYISPEVMEERILMVIRKYNVLYMEQLLKFFDGKEKAAGKRCQGF